MELRLVSPQADKPASDGLPALLQGSWSEDKLYFVSYFAELFNRGMKNRWKTRAYVDLFAGPGMSIDRNTGREFDGSPMRALACNTPFTHLFFNDSNQEYIESLQARQIKRWPNANVVYENKDCNLAAGEFANKLPKGALTLVFVDPWTYEVSFEGLSRLGERPFTDLIMTFHTRAIGRNVRHQVEAVDRFLDDPNWRERYWAADGDPSKPPTYVLIDMFQRRLADRLGYEFFGKPAVIPNIGSPMYYLLFASGNKRGLDFWEKSKAKTRQGQRPLFN